MTPAQLFAALVDDDQIDGMADHAVALMRRAGLVTGLEAQLLSRAEYWAWALGEFMAHVSTAPTTTDPPCPWGACFGWEPQERCDNPDCDVCSPWAIAALAVDGLRSLRARPTRPRERAAAPA